MAEELSQSTPSDTSVLALLCAKDHYVNSMEQADSDLLEDQSGQMKDDKSDEEYYDFSEENLTEGEPFCKKTSNY